MYKLTCRKHCICSMNGKDYVFYIPHLQYKFVQEQVMSSHMQCEWNINLQYCRNNYKSFIYMNPGGNFKNPQLKMLQEQIICQWQIKREGSIKNPQLKMQVLVIALVIIPWPKLTHSIHSTSAPHKLKGELSPVGFYDNNRNCITLWLPT